MPDFSDYILYADESGSPVLDGVDPDFPVFVLVLVLVRKQVYADFVVPSIQKLKFDFVGHDQIILHERDIRRQKSAFAFLQVSKELRATFLGRISELVAAADIAVFATVVDKNKLKARYASPWSPYEIALHLCMERVLQQLLAKGQKDRLVHVAFERRGAKEDNELELAFRRIVSNQSHWGRARPDFTQLTWEPVFVDKRCNSTGLQLADLFARPVGLRYLNPAQANHAYDVLEPKIQAGALKWFP